MDVAVVGGGIFGVTTAVELTQEFRDASVTLYERENDILRAASGINQWRLHRGYHYPRSKSTASMCLESEQAFLDKYSEAVITDHDHHYCIASERTKTTPKEYLEHCKSVGLAVECADLDVVVDESIDLCLRVNENHIDPLALKTLAWRRLKQNRVDVRLNRAVESARDLAEKYDYVVVAAYAGTNALVRDYPALRREYKYQVIEKPVVTLPPQFDDLSIVIMDGPFMSVDPYGHTNRFQLDHVTWGVRHEHVGEQPELGDVNAELLNNGLVEGPPNTRFQQFIDAYSEFFNDIERATHLGSYYTVRTVLPDKEETDARPTLVDRSENVFQIFGGKIGTCVNAAAGVINSISVDEN